MSGSAGLGSKEPRPVQSRDNPMKDIKRLNTIAAVGCALSLTAAYMSMKYFISVPDVRAFVGRWAEDARWMHTYSHILILGAMAGLIAVCLKLTALTWADLGAKISLTRREIVWGVVAGFAVYGTINSFHVLEHASPRQTEASLSSLFDAPRQHWLEAFLSVGLITGVLEELVYRGALVGFLRRGFGGGAAAAGLAAFASGLIFSVMHPLSGLNAYVLYAVIGAGLSLVYMHTGSLGVVMLAHVVANSIAVARGLTSG